MKSFSFFISLFLHIFILFFVLFSPILHDENTGVNLDQGMKFESIMIVSHLPIGEFKELAINQIKASNSKEENKKDENYALDSIANAKNTQFKASEKKSLKIVKKNEKSKKISSANNSNVLSNSKAKEQSLNAPLKSEEKTTQTIVNGNAKKQIQSYQALLMNHLLKFQKYPQQALFRKQEGKVSIRVIVDEFGNVLIKDIKKSSSYAILNNEALNLIKRASPLPKPPKEMFKNDDKITFVLPINYNIKEFLNRK